MSSQRPRTFRWLDPDQEDHDAVLRRLLQEASDAVPGLSSDPALTDPLVRLMLAAVSREYARLYRKLDGVVDTAYQRLVSNLLSFPRAPRPASAVFHLEVKDPGTTIDDTFEVVGRKAIGGTEVADEKSVHFTSVEEQTLAGLPSPVVLFEETSGQVHLLADGKEAPGAPPHRGPKWSSDEPGPARLHLGFDIPPEAQDEVTTVFLVAPDELLRHLVWSRWIADPSGLAFEFRPAADRRMEGWHDRSDPEMFRSRTDRGTPPSPYDRGFLRLPPDLLRTGVGVEIGAVLAGVHGGYLPSVPGRSWVTVFFDEPLQTADVAPLRVLTNCAVLFNLNRILESREVGSEAVQVVDLEHRFSEIFRLNSVFDADHRTTYQDAEQPEGIRAENRYSLEEAPAGNVRLRLSSRQGMARPRRLEVDLATTYADQANGLDPGSVDLIFDQSQCPGVVSAVNVTATAGGGAASHETHDSAELRALLASRGRAITAHDFKALVHGFNPDPVRGVAVERGVLEGARGVQSAVHVRVTLDPAAFANALELSAYRQQLQRYLQVRAPAGQSVTVGTEEA